MNSVGTAPDLPAGVIDWHDWHHSQEARLGTATGS